VEADARMYDQSESKGPLKTAFMIGKLLGLSDDVIAILWKLAGNKYRVRSRKSWYTFIIDKIFRFLRCTGGPNTAVDNSSVMGTSWFYVLCLLAPSGNLEQVKECFAFLGFDMKFRFGGPETCSFLKGMWYHTDRGLVWGPLPSRILKMGKSLTDPRTIYKTKDLNYATLRFMSDVAHSYKNFLQVPFVKEFVNNFLSETEVLHGAIEEHQVQATNLHTATLLPEAYEQICVRYNIDIDMLNATLACFPKHPFMFYSSPVFHALADLDYC